MMGFPYIPFNASGSFPGKNEKYEVGCTTCMFLNPRSSLCHFGLGMECHNKFMGTDHGKKVKAFDSLEYNYWEPKTDFTE